LVEPLSAFLVSPWPIAGGGPIGDRRARGSPIPGGYVDGAMRGSLLVWRRGATAGEAPGGAAPLLWRAQSAGSRRPP